MKPGFITYLRNINMSGVLIERIETILVFFEKMCPEEIEDIFVTDVIASGDYRQFESLWFFSKNFIMEAKEFIDKDNFDLTRIKKKIYYWEVKKENYDFQNANDTSRMVLNFKLIPWNASCNLKAAKNNCDYLKKISEKYLNVNLTE